MLLADVVVYLNSDWKILTIGDGDLSFSHSLIVDHGCNFVTASVLDDDKTLRNKYQENSIDALNQRSAEIYFGVDLHNKCAIPSPLKGAFDLVIFQFPLIPSFKDKRDYQSNRGLGNNVLNRFLIYRYLQRCFEYFLDPDGVQLSYITSKDVKPYSHWNMENLYRSTRSERFLGWQPFLADLFPSYRIRNVDRDLSVKSTSAKTYVWGKTLPADFKNIVEPLKVEEDYCLLCGSGPFSNADVRAAHQGSKGHTRLQKYEDGWQNAIKKGLLNE